MARRAPMASMTFMGCLVVQVACRSRLRTRARIARHAHLLRGLSRTRSRATPSRARARLLHQAVTARPMAQLEGPHPGSDASRVPELSAVAALDVLVADDDPASRTALCTAVVSLGPCCRPAASGPLLRAAHEN